MKTDTIQIPFFAKVSIFLVGLFVFLTMLYIAQSIIIPLVFAIIIAVLLHPVVSFLVRHRFNRVVAIVLSLILAILLLVALVILLYSQISSFSDSWPILVDKCTDLLNQSIRGIAKYFDIRPRYIHNWITKTRLELINNSSGAIEQTLLKIGGIAMMSFLVPVYIFMILFYQPLLLDFIRKLFGVNNKTEVSEVVSQIKIVIQRYLVGLLIEAVIIAGLYSITLFALGIEYALLLGIIGALINVIPFIGGVVGVALPMIVAFATMSSGWYALYIFLIFYVIQIIDNHFIIPTVVASKVKINALFSIIVVIAGNAFWGIPGMFLSIPLLGIVKLIFDHIEPLKPWGFLLGDSMPPILKLQPIIKKLLK
jgi:predicted PurR-regulated permease PerM